MKLASIDTIEAKELAGSPVLVRVDAEDDAKLRDALPTLAHLAEARARIVIATHGDSAPDGMPSADPIAASLSEMLGRPINRLDDWKGEAGLRAVSRLSDGEILLIENLARETGESTGDDALADAFGHLADIYCNEAFALAHQIRASTVGVAKHVERACAGIAFARELNTLDTMLGEVRMPSLAVLGGEASKEKLLLAEAVARRVERTFIAGQLVLPFLIARGIIPANAPVTHEMVIIAQRMMTEARESKRTLSTPVDYTVVSPTAFERLSRGRPFAVPPIKNVAENNLSRDLVLCDIGETTRWSWSDWFGPARTIFWHGPVGISEIDLFCDGSRFIAKELASRTWPTVHRVVICGGGLLTALRRTGLAPERIRHATHAGMAALHYFAERPLPAVDVLQRVAVAKAEPARVLIPLNGSERDTHALHAAAEAMARDAKIFLLHVRSGPDEEQYPDIGAGLNEAEKLARRIESERIFARANAILAARGLLSTQQVALQGAPIKVILRYARRMKAELIVVAATGPLEQLGARRLIDRAPCAALVARAH